MNLWIWPTKKSVPPVKELPEMNDEFVQVPELREPLIPLSVLALELADAPADGWTVWLAGRGISIEFDDLGRRAISRADAKQLLDAQRQNEIRRQDQAARLEAAAVAADRQRRAQLPRGLPWYEVVESGLTPAMAMISADPDRDKRPRRRSVLEDALDGGGTTMHILEPQPADGGS
jgi:hypothetical protein